MTNSCEEEAPSEMQQSSSESICPNPIVGNIGENCSFWCKKCVIKLDIVMCAFVLVVLLLLLAGFFLFGPLILERQQNVFEELEKNILAKLEQKIMEKLEQKIMEKLEKKINIQENGEGNNETTDAKLEKPSFFLFVLKTIGIGVVSVFFVAKWFFFYWEPKKSSPSNGQFLFRMTGFKAFAKGHGPNVVKSYTVGYIKGIPWQISIERNDDEIGFFLQCLSLKIVLPLCQRRAAFRLGIVSCKNGNESVKKKGNLDKFCVFTFRESSWGWKEFIKLKEVMDPKNGIYDEKEDAVTFKAEVVT